MKPIRSVRLCGGSLIFMIFFRIHACHLIGSFINLICVLVNTLWRVIGSM